MSDVSGIPYMGPMGTGGFFAPQFSYTPQMSAAQIGSYYMPQEAQNQNVLNNLFNTPGGGGGFGRATDYYSALGAQYSAAGMSPYGVFSEGGRGGGGASPYQTSPGVWDTGASPFQGGGGSSGLGGSIYDFGGGLGSLGASPYQTTPNVFDTGSRGFQFPGAGGIDWGGLANTARQSTPDYSSMFAGMGGGFGNAYQSQPAVDWGGLFGGSGGARADPYPGMAMPGGLNSPMTVPEQPASQPQATADPYPGMTMRGGLNAPMNFQQQQPIDYGSLFGQAVGGTAGGQPSGASVFDTGAAPVVGTEDTTRYGGGFGIDTDKFELPYTAPATPQYPSTGPAVGEAYNPYYGVTSPSGERSGGELVGPGGGLSATDLSGKARDQLAEYMRGAGTGPPTSDIPENATADELAKRAAAAVPQPDAEIAGEAGRGGMTGRPEATDPYEKLAEAIPLPRARPEGADVPRPPASIPATTEAERRAYQEPPRPPEDIRLSGPTLKGVNPRLVAAVEGGATFLPPGYHIELVSGKEPREFGYHPGGTAIDVRIVGPDGAIPHKGEDTTGMYTLLARGVKTWAAQNDPATAGQLGYGGAFGTRGGRPGEVPDLMHYDLGGSRGQMRPDVQFGNLKPLSEAERNAMPAYIPLLGADQVPLDGRVPTGSGTRAPVAPMQFGGGFGGDEFSGQMPSPGAFYDYPGFRQQGEDVESRIFEPSGRDQLARLQAESLPEVASTPLGRDLGLESRDLQEPAPTPLALDLGWNDIGRTAAASSAPSAAAEYPTYAEFLPYYPPGQATQNQLAGSEYSTLSQQQDLAAQRTPLLQMLEEDPASMRTLAALVNSEVGGASKEHQMAFIESVFNKIASGAEGPAQFQNLVNRNMTFENLFNSKYYQPIRDQTMGREYAKIDSDPGYYNDLKNMIRAVAYHGTNIGNLPTENASNVPGGQQMATEALRNQSLGLRLPLGRSGEEVLTRKDVLGTGMGDAYPVPQIREWYNRLTPTVPAINPAAGSGGR